MSIIEVLNPARRYGGSLTWDSVLGLLSLTGPRSARGLNMLSPRVELKHVAGQRGKPALNAVIALDENSNAAAHLAANIADPDFEILGTNAATSCVTYNPEGGLDLTTTTTSGDQVILLPHLDSNQTPWTSFTWGTDKETCWSIDFATGAAITTEIVWAGLKLTNTPTGATDDDQVMLRYEAGVSSGKWVLWTSIGGTDTTTVTDVTVAVSTRYRLWVSIDAARVARIWLSVGVTGEPRLIYTTAALTDAVDFKPYLGVQTATAGARVITYYGQTISRNVG